MSLVTLTFGSGQAKRADYPSPNAVVSTSMNRAAQPLGNKSYNGKLLVKKACRFYSHDNIFVVGEVAEGFIFEKMKGSHNSREIEIVDVESKHGHNAKKGMSVGIFLSGIDETELEIGSVLNFSTL